MNSWKVILTIVLATVLIFGAGVITGGLLVDQVKQPRPKAVKKPTTTALVSSPANIANITNSSNQPSSKPSRPPEVLSKQFLQQLDDALLLKPDQHDAVQKIINEGQNLMRKVVQDSRLEIREVLTSQQRALFDELVKRPFHRPLFDTNVTFQARLNLLLERQRTNQTSEPLSPETQVLLLEKERAQWTNSMSPLPPVPQTNAP